jgi:hypothetical protein
VEAKVAVDFGGALMLRSSLSMDGDGLMQRDKKRQADAEDDQWD